jgi:hypothetical protein
MEIFKPIKNYLKKRFYSHNERSDLYAYFIEQANKLLNKNGLYGVIVSNKFLRANYGKPLREYLANNTNVEQVIDFAGLPVFIGATVRTVILITSPKNEPTSATIYAPPLSIDKFKDLQADHFLSPLQSPARCMKCRVIPCKKIFGVLAKTKRKNYSIPSSPAVFRCPSIAAVRFVWELNPD